MGSRAAVVLWLAMFACAPKTGPAQPRDPPGSERESERGEVDSVRTEAAAECPREFEYAMHDAACEPGSAACSYPQADCHCVAQYPCTGVDPGFDATPLAHVWACTVRDPDLLRPDGCPARVPSETSACREDGQVCHWSPYCGGIQTTARCSNGTWQLEHRDIAPPPSAEF